MVWYFDGKFFLNFNILRVLYINFEACKMATIFIHNLHSPPETFGESRDVSIVAVCARESGNSGRRMTSMTMTRGAERKCDAACRIGEKPHGWKPDPDFHPDGTFMNSASGM